MLNARETTALVLALAADALQALLFPFFAEGAISPFDDALDVGMFFALYGLLGWHPLLLPTIAAELVPVVDVAPTWTMAVLIILWRRRGAGREDAGPAPGAGGEHVPRLPENPPRPGRES